MASHRSPFAFLATPGTILPLMSAMPQPHPARPSGTRLRSPSFLSWFLLAVSAQLLSGCGREEIAVYEAPKDAAQAPAAANPHGAAPGGDAGGAGMAGGPTEAKPGLRWKQLPEGWTERGSSGMRVANFTLPAPNGGKADLAVIPLPGTGGGDLDLVNLWRGQLNLPPITEAELARHTDEGRAGDQPYKLFSIVGSETTDAAAAGNQIVVAALRREGFTWFFKLAGDAAAVDSNRESLKAFLATVEFTAPVVAPPHAMMAGAAAGAGPVGGGGPAADGTPKPTWQVPATWSAVPPTQMVHSKWTLGGDGKAGGEVAVSVFRGEAGGLVANLNRWRAKVGLGPAPAAELQPLADNFEVAGGKATLVDFVGSDLEGGEASRLVGAIVRRDGWTWYYRLTGSPSLVEQHRNGFIEFVKTAQY